MSEEKEESGMSAIKKTIIGAITTAVTAGGAWFATHLGGGEESKEDAKTEQAAPAPVIVNVQQSQENKQQVKQGGTNTIIKERVIEKPVAAPATKPKPDEEDPW
jgi:flagellar basal body-associated protein FliL